jgi:two-component system, NarL family, response regulator NreC
MSQTEVHPKSRILIVDDHPILRHGIAQLLNRESDLEVCAEAGDRDEALAMLSRQAIDLAVVDISLEGVSGIELLKAIRERHPSVRCLVLSMHDESLYAERALRAGALGYVMKQEATKRITTALRRIRDGQIYVSERLGSQLVSRLVNAHAPQSVSPLDFLSDRELEVLRLIGQGHKTGDIAQMLKRSVNTVDAHRANIKRKLNLKNGTELARVAFQFNETHAAPDSASR